MKKGSYQTRYTWTHFSSVWINCLQTRSTWFWHKLKGSASISVWFITCKWFKVREQNSPDPWANFLIIFDAIKFKVAVWHWEWEDWLHHASSAFVLAITTAICVSFSLCCFRWYWKVTPIGKLITSLAWQIKALHSRCTYQFHWYNYQLWMETLICGDYIPFCKTSISISFNFLRFLTYW